MQPTTLGGTTIRNIAFLLLMCALIATSASAACGGGGWKKAPSSSTSNTSTAAPETNTAAKALPPPPAEYADNHLDTSWFSSISGSLNMNLEQVTAVVNDINAIRAMIDKLKQAQYDAHALYAECKDKDDCTAKLEKFKEAVAAVKSFDPVQELDTRLAKDLSAQQVETYKAAKVAKK